MKYLFLCFYCLIGTSLYAQKLPDFGLERVRIIQPDKIIQADIKPIGSDPSMDVSLLYYWYSSNAIHITQGGFSGKLLNGVYTEYYLNKNLKEQGRFKKGLKSGIWKTWADNGNLLQTFTWKNGARSGVFYSYSKDGKVQQTGKYSHDHLNGRVLTYAENGVPEETFYRDGALQAKSSKPSFWQKINIFKKRTKKTDAVPPVKK